MYAIGMDIGGNIRLAMSRNGIGANVLCEKLHITPKAIYAQWRQPNPTYGTLERYASAMTAVLNERGDRRVFTPESLQDGPDPVYQEPQSTAAADAEQPAEVNSTVARIIAALQAQGYRPDRPRRSEDWLRVPLLDGASCGYFDPTADRDEAVLVSLPRHVAGPGATAQNTQVWIARGESMVMSNIRDGDELTVRLDLTPKDGSIVLAHCNGGVTVRAGQRPSGSRSSIIS